jgi:hypothetical protein
MRDVLCCNVASRGHPNQSTLIILKKNLLLPNLRLNGVVFIEVDLLGQLDDQVLKDIGVSSARQRLRIRNAITKLSPLVPPAKNDRASAAATEPKAGQRSLERSALAEAVEQFTRALDQIANLPSTPALRQQQIKLQVALITPLIHFKGQAAPETQGSGGAGTAADRTS